MRIDILIYPGFTALDAIGPFEVFNCLRCFDVRLVWKEVGPVPADGGALVVGANHALRESGDCDLLLIPGSSAHTPTLMADTEVLQWIRDRHAATRCTASVCSGSLILAAAGLLEGLPATSHWGALPVLSRFGARPEPDRRIVRSGKIVTAAGVSAGIDLALYLVAELLGEAEARLAQLLIEYDPQPPFDAGHMSRAGAELERRARHAMRRNAAHPRNLVAVPKLLLQRWQRARARRFRAGGRC